MCQGGVNITTTTGNKWIYHPCLFQVSSKPKQLYLPECDWENLSPPSTWSWKEEHLKSSQVKGSESNQRTDYEIIWIKEYNRNKSNRGMELIRLNQEIYCIIFNYVCIGGTLLKTIEHLWGVSLKSKVE